MFTHLASGVVGAVLANRSRPRTRIVQRHVYGPKTGSTYFAEELPDSDVLIIHADDGSQATFLRAAGKGWVYVRGRGNEPTVKGIRMDLENE